MPKQFRSAKGIVAMVLLAVALVFGQAALAKEAKPGKARWLIKTSLPEDADVDHPKEVPLLRLLILEEPPGVKHNDKRYQTAWIPDFVNSLDMEEGDIISTSGWLHLVAAEDDGDYHIQISATPTDGNNCLIVEVPRDDPHFVTSPQVRQLAAGVREFIHTQVLHGRDLGVGGVAVVQPAVYVKITGALFFDDAHVGDRPRGKKGMKAKTLWEIHPVTKMEAATPPQR